MAVGSTISLPLALSSPPQITAAARVAYSPFIDAVAVVRRIVGGSSAFQVASEAVKVPLREALRSALSVLGRARVTLSADR